MSYVKNSTGDLEIKDSNDYYPFGMNFLNPTGSRPSQYDLLALPYNYKYNGKELQETGMYDYGARFYMPDIVRTPQIDPLAEKMPWISPYAYAFNNPISFIDPTGMEPEDWIRQNGKWVYNANVTTVEQAQKKPDVDGFAKNGTVLANASVNSGDAGYVRLNEGGTVDFNPVYGFEDSLTDAMPMSLGGTWTTWTHESFPQITNNGGLARSDFDASSWDKFRAGDKLFNLDMGSFVQPGSLPGGNSFGERFSAFAEGMKNLSDLGGLFKSQPDTLHIKATFVHPEDGVLFRDTIFSEPYRKNESFNQVYNRLNKKYDSVKANSSKFLTR